MTEEKPKQNHDYSLLLWFIFLAILGSYNPEAAMGLAIITMAGILLGTAILGVAVILGLAVWGLMELSKYILNKVRD
jgi:hypothetical protein